MLNGQMNTFDELLYYKYSINQLHKKIRRTEIGIIIVVIILILVLLYKLWFPFIVDRTPIGEFIKNELPIKLPEDTPDDENEDEDDDISFNKEKEAYIVNLKLDAPKLSSKAIKKYTTEDLQKIAKDKKKQVICTEFYSSDGFIYDTNPGSTVYYSFDDVLKQIDSYTENISLTQVSSGSTDTKSHYTNYELIYNMEVGVAVISNKYGEIEFYGYSKETVDDYKENLENSKQTVSYDGVIISVKGKGINPNRVSQAIAKSIPSVKYLNYDSTFIGLLAEKDKIIYKSYEGDKDITEKVVNAIKGVDGVKDVIIGDVDCDMKFCVTTDVTIPNDLALIIDNKLY